MSVIINGITCEEIARKDGLREHADVISGFSARKGYFVPNWADRYKVINGLLGLSNAIKVGTQITLYTPAPYPEVSGVFAHNVEVEPVGSPSQGARQVQWPSCIIWVEYSRLPFFANSLNQLDPTNPQVFATQRISISTEYITIPATNLQFKTSGNVLTSENSTDPHYAFPMSIMEYELTYHQIPWLPNFQTFTTTLGPTSLVIGDTSTPMAGSINNATFLQVPAGRLMFKGVSTDQSATYDGTYTQTISFSFAIRQVPWDFAWDSTAKKWDQVVLQGTSQGIIPRLDFSTLLPSYNQLN